MFWAESPQWCDQQGQFLPVDQLNRFAQGKTLGALRVSARGDEDGAIRSFRRENTVKLPDGPHSNLVNAPLLALNQEDLTRTVSEFQVDPSISTATPGFRDLVTQPPIGFPHKKLEIQPTQGTDGIEPLLFFQEPPAQPFFDLRSYPSQKNDNGEKSSHPISILDGHSLE